MLIEPIDPDGKTLARGGLMRGWAGVLQGKRLLEDVCGLLTSDVVVLLRHPPASTEWVDVAYYECVAEAVLRVAGEPRLSELFVEASRTGWAVLLTRWAGGIIRVFGPSPGTLLKHAEAAAKANTVGFSLKWEQKGARSGELVAHYHLRSRIHPAAAWGTSAACQLAADVAGVTMRREQPVIQSVQGGTVVRAPVSW